MARWFAIALGIVGWTALGLSAAAGIEDHTSAAWTALFFSVILASRALAFQPSKGAVLSLGSAFHVAVVLCAGPVLAGLLVAAALTLDAAGRLLGAHRREQERGRAELPITPYREGGDKTVVTPPREEAERGVMIIDI